MFDELLVLNELNCPLLLSSDNLVVIPSVDVHNSVSVVHECGSSCECSRGRKIKVEREDILLDENFFKHDYTNRMYCLNSYCIKLYCC